MKKLRIRAAGLATIVAPGLASAPGSFTIPGSLGAWIRGLSAANYAFFGTWGSLAWGWANSNEVSHALLWNAGPEGYVALAPTDSALEAHPVSMPASPARLGTHGTAVARRKHRTL